MIHFSTFKPQTTMSVFCCCNSHRDRKSASFPNQLTSECDDIRSRPPEIPCGNPLETNELVVNDSNGPGIESRLGGQASTALSAVRIGLARNLSSQSASKHQPSVTIGISQESIHPRAKMRRLRHKMILNELRANCGTDNAIRKPLGVVRQVSAPTKLSLLRGRPRDHVEFIVPQSENVENEDTSRHFKDVKASALPLSTSPQLPASQGQASFATQCDDNQSTLGIWLEAQRVQSWEELRPGKTTMENAAVSEHTSKSNRLGVVSGSVGPTQRNPYSGNHQKSVVHLSSRVSASSIRWEQPQDYPGSGWDKESVVSESSSKQLARNYAAAMAFIDSVDSESFNHALPSPAHPQSNIHQLEDQDIDSLRLSTFPCRFRVKMF